MAVFSGYSASEDNYELGIRNYEWSKDSGVADVITAKAGFTPESLSREEE